MPAMDKVELSPRMADEDDGSGAQNLQDKDILRDAGVQSLSKEIVNELADAGKSVMPWLKLKKTYSIRPHYTIMSRVYQHPIRAPQSRICNGF